MEEEFRGIILYDIQLNGDLNGVYTNNLTPNAELFTETARFLRDASSGDFSNGNMVYDCFYFDFEAGRVNATLVFEIQNRLIRAQWLVNDKIVFIGEGYQMNERQIAIAYWLLQA